MDVSALPVDSECAPCEFLVLHETNFGCRVMLVGEWCGWDAHSGVELTWSEGHVWRGEARLRADSKFKFCVIHPDGYLGWELGMHDRLMEYGAAEVQCTFNVAGEQITHGCRPVHVVQPKLPPVYDEDEQGGAALGDWVGDGETDEIDVEATSVESSSSPAPSPALNDEEAFEAAKALEAAAAGGAAVQKPVVKEPVVQFTGEELARPESPAAAEKQAKRMADEAEAKKAKKAEASAAKESRGKGEAKAAKMMETAKAEADKAARASAAAVEKEEAMRALEEELEKAVQTEAETQVDEHSQLRSFPLVESLAKRDGANAMVEDKLRLVEQMLGWGKSVDVDTLALCKIYLQWIQQGKVSSDASGSPSERERDIVYDAGSSVFRNLERAAGDTYAATKLGAMEVSLLRQIHAMLPAVAGPADGDGKAAALAGKERAAKLATASLPLAELSERLDVVRMSLDDSHHPLVDDFLEAASLAASGDDGGKAASVFYIVDCLDKTTELRSLLAKGLETGMRNDAPDNAVWMRQQWRLCEMSLEATAHRLLTRTITELTRGATAGYGAQWEGWVYAPWALALALSHVRLSRWAPIECTVLVLELGAWAAEGDAAHHPAAALRMQATVDRAARLARDFRRQQRDEVAPRAWALGDALGLSPEEVRGYLQSEEQRSMAHVVTQLCGLFRKGTSSVAGNLARAMETVAAGTVAGALVQASAIREGVVPPGLEAAVLLVDRIEGTEELMRCDDAIKGVVVCQELPRTSALAMRARQEGVVIATVQDLERLAAIKRLVGSPVALVADATGVVIEPVPPNLALQVKAGVLPKDMRNKLLTARPSSSVALDSTRASVNSPQHLRDQQQSNITVQRDADGALNVTLSPTTSAQASQTVEKIDRLLNAVSVDNVKAPVATSPAAVMAEQTRNCKGSGGRDAHSTAYMQVEALTAALPEGTVSDLVLHPRGTVLSLLDGELEVGDGGPEALAAAKVAKLAKRQAADGVSAPAGVCLPFSTLEWALRDAGGAAYDHYYDLLAVLETADEPTAAQVCEEVQTLLRSLPLPEELLAAVAKVLGEYGEASHCVAVPCTNVEGLNATGLYADELGAPLVDPAAISAAVAGVWASLFSLAATKARRAAGVPQSAASMAVVLRARLKPSVSFVLCTHDPTTSDPTKAYAEVVVGKTRTLRSSMQGSPWVLSIDKAPGGHVETLAFANFSSAAVATDAPRNRKGERRGTEPIDYSMQPLSTDAAARTKLGQRLAMLARLVDGMLEGAHEVEGVVVGDHLYLLRAYPQQLSRLSLLNC